MKDTGVPATGEEGAPGPLMRLADAVPAVVIGLVTVVVGFSSSAVLIVTAARAAGADVATSASWLLAVSVGVGVTSIALSWWYRVPLVTGWSTPGAALLVTGLVGVPVSGAIGAFAVAALLVVLAGWTGLFERLMDRVPAALSGGLLAGVLVSFGTGVFAAASSDLVLIGVMVVLYAAGRRWYPRWAVVAALVGGVLVAVVSGRIDTAAITWSIARPVAVVPTFTPATILGVALPLWVVTMTSQNIPGVAAIRGAGFTVPISRVVTVTGLTTLVLAPLGCFSVNLSTIGAAVCMSEEAHRDPRRRFVAGIAAGVFFVVFGLFALVVVTLFAALPPALVIGVAGLALLGSIGNALAGAVAEEGTREAAVVTFLVAASGVTIAGVGSAFWALVAGVAMLLVARRVPLTALLGGRRRRRESA